MRSRSSVVAPDRRPWPCSARRTQWRSVSPEQPIFSAIEWIADHWEVCSAWWSRTIRTARARTSGEYGGTRFVMAPSSQELEPPENPVRFKIVIMDNLGSHKRQAIRRLIRAAGAKLIFLPPYSPDLNPIEQFFAKLKALLRKADERTP